MSQDETKLVNCPAIPIAALEAVRAEVIRRKQANSLGSDRCSDAEAVRFAVIETANRLDAEAVARETAAEEPEPATT